MELNIIWNIDPEIFSIGNFQFRYYSLCWLMAFAGSIFVLRKIYIKELLDPELLFSLAIYIFFGVVIGARLGHCLFYDPDYYLSHPLEE
jgi:prolipoprotein diacylglyceryltransferase